MLNHLINFHLFEAKKSVTLNNNPEFDDGEVFAVGDMVWIDPYYCKKVRSLDPGVQYEIIEIEGNNVWIFDDNNDYISIRKSKLNIALDKVPEKDIRWFEDGKLEEN